MTRDDIIRMAREAGFVDASFCRWSAYTDDLERFAALVAAAEREACAKVAEAWGSWIGDGGQLVANAIRARGDNNAP
jgi:hypothetical protein